MKTPLLHRAFALLVLCIALAFGSAIPATAVSVKFQVNMEIQAIIGTFNPGGGHTVEVHGSFDNWGAGFVLSPSAANANIYEGTREITDATGSQVQYKFVINQSGTLVWEGAVGAGGADNRAFNVPASAETLPVVFFNNQSTPPGVVAVTFQIDMSVQQSLRNFDPSVGHTVEAHGSFDTWGPGIMLTNSPNNTNIYSGSFSINGSAGALYEYKFVINQGGGTLTWEGNVGPGGPFGNRTFNLGTSPQILPVVYFNNLTNNPGTGIPVTFRLSMEVAIARGTFNPVSGTVVVAGEFNNWSPNVSLLTNSTENPYLYIGTVNIISVPAGGSVGHKFVLNGGTWEMGDNRVFILEGPTQTLPIEYFDRVANLGTVTIAKVEPFFFQFTVSWLGGPLIRLQSSPDPGGPWTEVPGSLGQSSAFIDLAFEEERPPTFYRLIAP